MPYHVHRMRKEDIAQVTEIDREAFPTQWPTPNYHDELRNPLAHYIVVCDGADEPPDTKNYQAPSPTGLISRLKRWLNRNDTQTSALPSSHRYRVVSFAGIWLMADEAHLVSIAVRRELQRQGIGELLLIAIIELAKELKASVVTLEVRASNTSAQQLYVKYGFTEVGVRKGYYTDNKESALLMSAESIRATSFLDRFQQLRAAHSQKWGITSYLSVSEHPAPPDR